MGSPYAERFWSKVDKDGPNGCWVWTAGKTGWGYGAFKIAGKQRPAHIVSYELVVGPVPTGLELDHLCEVISCVNPEHLEAVDHRTNMLRTATTGAAVNSQKTHCVHGHQFDAVNTYWRADGSRECRRCRADAASRSHTRKAKGLV